MVTKNTIYKYIGILNVFVFFILTGLYLVTQHAVKGASADQFAHTSRYSILSGDTRSFDSTKRALLGEQFVSVIYKSSKNKGRSQDFSIITDSIKIPIYYGNTTSRQAGALIFEYNRFSSASYPLAFTLLFLLFLSFPVGFKIRARLNSNQQREMEAKRNQAVALTTQGLAHDVRKPFTMIKIALDMLVNTEPDKMKDFVKMMVPEVDKAIAAANGMITDVMEISSKAKLNLEPVNPEVLIETVLSETIRLYPKATVNISYDFQHQNKVMVDSMRIARVFGNIVINAVQSMRQKGDLWFFTKVITNKGTEFIEFEIGNSGSFIPQEDIKQLFDFFFTKNKKGGTGLGLAIAKKLVNEHGGEIRCISTEGKGTSFILSLPIANQSADFNGELPASSSDIKMTKSPLSS